MGITVIRFIGQEGLIGIAVMGKGGYALMAIVVDGLDMPWSCMACPFKVYRDYDDVSVCVATNPNGVDCATPVELPTTKGRSSFCPLKELKERQ